MKRNSISLAAALTALVLAAVLASALTLMGTVSADGREITDEELEIIERYERLEQVRKTLVEKYYEEVDEDVLVQGAIDGMLASLEDPYTFYYTKKEMEDRMESQNGEYRGVGMSVTMNGEGAIDIIRVFKDSPADHAGIYPGDVLIAIDGETLNIQTTEDLDEAVSRMRGVEGTEVTLTVMRNGETIDFTMNRGSVTINYAEYQLIDDIGYVRLYEFEESTSEDLEEALTYFREENVSGVVLDLRSNPGGLIDEAVCAADQFLPKGRVVYTEDRAGNVSSYYSTDEYWDIPLVVLIDQYSASASELLSGALQDNARATLVGTNSFGKGIAQLFFSFPDGEGMQYTEAHYYLPSGRCIHKVGLQPDVEVELQESYDPSIRTVDLNNDNQLAKAIEVLREKIEAE